MAGIIIPARYASTRFPQKMLAPLGGRPLIVRTALAALESKAESVTVATDHEDIAKSLHKIGVKVVMSPPDLRTGTDRVAFAARETKDEVIINVQGDEPFTPPALLNELIDIMEKGKEEMASIYTQFESAEAVLSKDAVKVVLDSQGYALYFSRARIPFDRDGSAPKYFRHIGMYAYRRDFLFKFASLEKTPLEAAENLEQLRALEYGYKIRMLKTDYTPISVDTAEDLKRAEEYLQSL